MSQAKQVKLEAEFYGTYVEPNLNGEAIASAVRRLIVQGVEAKTSSIELDATPIDVFTSTKPESRMTIAERLNLPVKFGRTNSYETSVVELANATMELTGQSLNDLVNAAMAYYCQRQLSLAYGNGGEVTAKQAGSADDDIQQAYTEMVEGGEPITTSKLAKKVGTNYYTVKRFLEKIGHQ